MANAEHYKKVVLYLTAIVLFTLLVIAGWDFLQKTAGRIAGDFFYPYMRVARTGFDRLSDQTLLVFSRRELASQLEMLRAENTRLAGQAAAAAELLLENERLRRILNLPSPATWEHIPAEVILRDPRFWHEQLTIDRGSMHGIRIGSAAFAVSDGGMPVFVGVVSSLSRKTATIMTVYNPELRMSAVLPRSGTAGIIHTGTQLPGKGMLPIGFLPLRQPYTIGEVLQTSGFERNIPPGLKIGNLGNIQSTDSLFSGELYLSGGFTPAMRLNEVRFLILAVRRETPAKGMQ